MEILVTGAAGFIGSHFVEHLLSQSAGSIVAVDDFNARYDPAIKQRNATEFASHPGVTMIQADFCEWEAMLPLFVDHDFTHVVHLGAHAGVRASVGELNGYLKNNVAGTQVLFDLALEHANRLQQFVFVSSSTVYGRKTPIPFCEEESGTVRNSPLRDSPVSPYGLTKQLAESLARWHHEQHGLPVTCVRPFSVYGPRMRPDLAMPIFAGQLLSGERLTLNGDGLYRRDMTHVSDVCRGIYAAMTKKSATGEAINLGCDHPVSLIEVISALATELGVDGWQERIDFRPADPADLANTWADLTKAKRILEYSPQISFDDGVKSFTDWYILHLNEVV